MVFRSHIRRINSVLIYNYPPWVFCRSCMPIPSISDDARIMRRVLAVIIEECKWLLERYCRSSTIDQWNLLVNNVRPIFRMRAPAYVLPCPKLGTPVKCLRKAVLAHIREQFCRSGVAGVRISAQRNELQGPRGCFALRHQAIYIQALSVNRM